MKINRRQCITYAFVIAAYIVLQILSGQKVLSSTARGMLVPICAYVVMAISLNLTVGVMGELSLGHAGFMSVGAFMGTTAAVSLQDVIASAPLRLAIAMVIGAIFAAIIGFLIGIPVLRLRGDYLAIVTLAFGEIIKSIFTNLYIGLDSRGYHIRFLQAPENLEEGGKLILGGPMGIGGVQKIATFTGGFILVMLCLIVIFHLVNSRTGRAILAIRDNRIAAGSGMMAVLGNSTIFPFSNFLDIFPLLLPAGDHAAQQRLEIVVVRREHHEDEHDGVDQHAVIGKAAQRLGQRREQRRKYYKGKDH